MANSNKGVRYLFAIFLPPIGVALTRGYDNSFWLNLMLCFLLWIPAIFHAVYIVNKSPAKIYY